MKKLHDILTNHFIRFYSYLITTKNKLLDYLQSNSKTTFLGMVLILLIGIFFNAFKIATHTPEPSLKETIDNNNPQKSPVNNLKELFSDYNELNDLSEHLDYLMTKDTLRKEDSLYIINNLSPDIIQKLYEQD